MAKPTPFKDKKRQAPLLQSAYQTGVEAVALDEASNHNHNQSQIIGLVAALAAKADDANVVHNSGAENIDGVKTFLQDLKFSLGSKGVVLIDRTTTTAYRLYVDSGVLGIEAV